jgi:ATP-dependent protease ClpP protease subunit
MNPQSSPEQQQKIVRKQTRLNELLQEFQQIQTGTPIRQEIIKRIENLDPAKPRRLLLYIANMVNPNSAINPGHTVPIGDALADIQQGDNLDLMIHTNGGSGEAAEKIVEMCRHRCSGEFRVIIPNMAKSAGTLIALGADKIIMGHCSEVGPIDPQIRITVGNMPQYVSAWTFIRARDELAAKVNEAIAKRENPAALLQQLATIDSVFVKHCEQLMEFSQKVGGKWIADRLKANKVEPQEASTQASKVIEFLSDVEEHIVHGRLILARELAENCQPPLSVEELQESSELWQLIWELYLRCEFFLMIQNSPMPMVGVPNKAVLIETARVSFTLNG